MKKWLCLICGWIYDEAKGWPTDGIAAGTKWEDIPEGAKNTEQANQPDSQ